MKFLNNHTQKGLYYFNKAKENQRPLYESNKSPISIVSIFKDKNSRQGWGVKKIDDIANLPFITLNKGDSIILDFGDDLVGFPTFQFQTVGSPQDAPAHLRLTFGEVPGEAQDQAEYDNYDGWLSSSWLQQEVVHLDNANSWLKLKRRYTFRYLKIEVLDTSAKYQIKLVNVLMHALTGANPAKTPAVTTSDSDLVKIDRIALKTLRNNMQDFFEDAPKRDQRLWLGDMWETTKANYYTYQNFDLSKRCLYLFAAAADQNGRVPGDVFLVNDEVVADDIYWMTWLLLYGATLYDYYQASGDKETLEDLFPVALTQIKNSVSLLDDRNLVPEFQFSQSNDEENGGSFIDWSSNVDNQAATQAVFIYAVKCMKKLADELNDIGTSAFLDEWDKKLENAAMQYFWSEKDQLFTSGSKRQVSLVTQIWFANADILGESGTKRLLQTALHTDAVINREAMPFNQNVLFEMLLKYDLRSEGVQALKNYYGYMVSHGADAFWEIVDFEDSKASPYGSYIINSYCHGWGSYPSYLIRKYDL